MAHNSSALLSSSWPTFSIRIVSLMSLSVSEMTYCLRSVKSPPAW
jgi:hypothetical protein